MQKLNCHRCCHPSGLAFSRRHEKRKDVPTAIIKQTRIMSDVHMTHRIAHPRMNNASEHETM